MAKRAATFREALALMRKRDPQIAEDGFHYLRSMAAEHAAELIAEFESEQDHGIRCWLLDLIGETRSPTAFTLFCGHALGDDDSLRDWAIAGLRKLDTADARRFLFDRGLS